MKKCSICHQSDVEFSKNASKSDGLQTACKGCQRSINKSYYFLNKNKAQNNRKVYRKQVRQWVFDYLKSHPCIDCGENDPIVLEFDHRFNKKMNVSEMIRGGFAIESIQNEIDKCDVRCANCHRRKTAKDFEWYSDLT